MTQTVKNRPAMQETQVLSLDGEDTLETGMATNPLQYSCLENSKTEEPGTTFHGGCKESDTTEQPALALFRAIDTM